MTYKHREAFCLMWYACTEGKPYMSPQADDTKKRIKTVPCGHREQFWNSRDGVTPFGLTCPSCGGTLTHVDWKLDQRKPDHEPYPHQGVWVDMDATRNRRIAERTLRGAQASGHLVSISVDEWVAKNPLREGEPMLIRANWNGVLEG